LRFPFFHALFVDTNSHIQFLILFHDSHVFKK
jgi:hypothetical protein